MDEYEQVEQEANEEQIQRVEAGTGSTSLRISWGRRRGEFVGNLTNVPSGRIGVSLRLLGRA
jgi:hypothetical protein